VITSGKVAEKSQEDKNLAKKKSSSSVKSVLSKNWQERRKESYKKIR
jgi:hypothetical protein